MTTLPDSWALVRVADIAEHNLGKMLDRSKHTTGNELPYLRNINVQWFRIDTDDLLTMFFRDDELPRYTVREGDLLICEGGEPGRCAIWDGRLSGIMYQKALHRLRPANGISSDYIAYHLRHDASRRKLDDYFTGTTIKHFTGRALARYEMRLPPRQEQRRIVAKIESLFERSRRAKQALDAIPPLLDKLRQSILAAAFRGDLTADWRAQNPNVEPADKLLERIRTERRDRWEQTELTKLRAKGKEPKNDKWKAKYREPEALNTSQLPDLPSGWKYAPLEALSSKISDGVHKKPNYVAEGVPFVTVKNLTAGAGISFEKLNYITPEDHEEFKKRTDPENGDILISKDGTLGVVRAVRTDKVFNVFVSVALVKPLDYGLTDYLEHVLTCPQVQGRISGTGSGLQHIHLKDLRRFAIPIAPPAEHVAIVKQVDRALKRLSALEQAFKNAASKQGAMDQAILAKAFRGELVEQDPNDEPASVLLERIRAAREAAKPVKKKKAKRRVGGKKNAEI